MKTALLFSEGNFVGREYHAALTRAGLKTTAIAVGKFSEASKAYEIERTGGLWNPPDVQAEHKFENLTDPDLIELLNGYDLAIQGGIGIIGSPLLAAPKRGWLNIHPGDLPKYRGSSCPEWAVHNNDPVILTAHMLDEGLDTGPILAKAEYKFERDYHKFRAGIYPNCAELLVSVIQQFEMLTPEPQGDGKTWKRMDDQWARDIFTHEPSPKGT